MVTNSRVLKGTPQSAATAQSFIAPAHPGSGYGIPFGIDMRTGKLLCVDQYELREKRIVNGLIMRVDGVRESGKSTLLKCLVLRALGMQAGLDDNGRPLPMRARITDQRPEEGQGEYTALTTALRSQVITPMQMGKINPFDPVMSNRLSLLETAINLSETAMERRLTGLEPLVHQVAMAKMCRDYFLDSGPQTYEYLLRTLTMEDVNTYFKSLDAQLVQAIEARQRSSPDLTEQLQIELGQPPTMLRVEFERAAGQMGASISRLLDGDYGQLLGNGISMRELLSQPVTTIDQSGMSVRVRNVFDALMGKWLVWAMENNQLDLIPHINVGDEAQDSYKSLMWLRFYDEFVRKARAYHMWDVRATQFSNRLQFLAAEGTEERELAKTIDLGVSMRLIGLQPNTDEVLQELNGLGFSDQDAYFCTQLPMGCFALKLPDRPAVFFQWFVTDIEAQLIQTNAANRRMMERVNVWSLEDVQRRAAEKGTISLEEAVT